MRSLGIRAKVNRYNSYSGFSLCCIIPRLESGLENTRFLNEGKLMQMGSTDELVQFVETLVSRKTGNGLSFIQKTILRESLAESQKTYAQIAQEIRYSEAYVKQLVAPKLWQLLSSILSEKVNKTNCRSLLEYKLRSGHSTVTPIPAIEIPSLEQTPFILESPEGQVPLSSLLYIERDAIEPLTFEEILQPGAFIRIKAPRRMGKTSLMARILAYATTQKYHTVRLNLQSAGSPSFTSIDKFLRWFCAMITKKLGLEPRLDEYWDEDIGALVSSTLYFESYILANLKEPLVLALDELNQIFEYPTVAKDFLALLRSWHEETKDISIWQKLRFILLHSTDIYIPLETYQSPFNVGLAIELPPLEATQVEQLANAQGLSLVPIIRSRLMRICGGFPYLVRLALYHSIRHHIDLEVILDQAIEDGGIYKNYLRSQLQKIQKEPRLFQAIQDLLEKSDSSFELETSAKLWGLGLIQWKNDRFQISCDLYQSYFQRIFLQLGVR